MALGVEGMRMKVSVKAGHPEPEGEGSHILHRCSSQSLTTTLTRGSDSRGNQASELPLFCNTNLAAQPTPTRGPGSNPQSRRQESCPKPTAPRAGSGGQQTAAPRGQPAPACPGPEEANRPTHAHHSRALSAPRWAARPGEFCQHCRWAKAASKLRTGGFQQEQPELHLNWCPSTESSKFHPQPPQNFHLSGSTQRKEEESVHRVPSLVDFSAAPSPRAVPSPMQACTRER